MAEVQDDGDGPVKLIYILYLTGLVTGGVTTIVGVVIAYLNRADAPDWLATHYQFQIRTFWIGLLFVVIGSATTVILIGFLILLAQLVWFIIRCVKGFQRADRGESIDDVETWWI
jgi:uncharacterized membrane protein